MVQGKRTVWVALNKSLLVCPDEDFLLVRTRDVATALFSLFACFFFFWLFLPSLPWHQSCDGHYGYKCH